MANSVALTSVGLLTRSLITKPNNPISTLTSRSPRSVFRVQAAQENEGRRRLVDIIRVIPEASRNYFRSPSRRALFGGISLLGGFYVAQTISLSFGALGVNDVIAAVLCVLITEYVTRFYYSRPKVTFSLALLNNFKMGFTYANTGTSTVRVSSIREEVQNFRQDDFDPDRMTYEELQSLGESVGSESRGLSADLISRLPTFKYKLGLFSKKKKDREECVICCAEYKNGAKMTSLPCAHQYHANCITPWLQQNKQCPICQKEVEDE